MRGSLRRCWGSECVGGWDGGKERYVGNLKLLDNLQSIVLC